MWRRIVDCVGVPVGVTSHVDEITTELEAVLRMYADSANAPVVEFELAVHEWPQLMRDGELVSRHNTALDVVPAFELELYRHITARANGILLHAAGLVDVRGAGLVISGRSGGGKSTLVRALVSDTFQYASEECVAIESAERARGLCRALHLEDASIDAPFETVPYRLHVADGGIRETRLCLVPEARIWRDAFRPAAIVVINHAPDAPNACNRLHGGAALASWWPMVFRPDDAALQLATVLAIPTYRLSTRTPAAAREAVLAVAQEHALVVG
jgi:hypothetical protein